MLSFLKPICDQLKPVETNGVTIDHPAIAEPFQCCGFLLAGSCDLPAKCMVCNSIQFNGYYGCLKCKIKSTSSATAKGYVTTFPYKDAIDAEPRTKESDQQNARAVVNGDVDFVGAPSWLACLKHFDIINGNSIDYMHCVLLGVVKTLMKL